MAAARVESATGAAAGRARRRRAPRRTLWLRSTYAEALYKDGGATLDDLREAVTTLEDTTRIARRVFGGANPLTEIIEDNLQNAGAALRAMWCPRIAVFEEFCDLGW